jgi:hypothetical protein
LNNSDLVVDNEAHYQHPANLRNEKKAAARRRENQQRARLAKREKRAAEKTLSVTSAHGKANAAKESRDATENTNHSLLKLERGAMEMNPNKMKMQWVL